VRLYLSSFRLGEHPKELVRLAGPGARVAVIGNAVDGLAADDRRAAVERELVDLAGLGLKPGDGLGVVDHAVVLHVQSPDHPESAACDAVAERYRSTGVPDVTLRDGQARVVDGDTTTVV